MNSKQLLGLALMFFFNLFLLNGQNRNYNGIKIDTPDKNNILKEFNVLLNKNINYHSGGVNIDIPLYEVKIKECLSIPISLNYKTTGIKVSSRPSQIGLGWEMQAGGFIQREVRGRSDDGGVWRKTYSLSATNYSEALSYSSLQNLRENSTIPHNMDYPCNYPYHLYTGHIDGASDIYHFSFGGNQGRFVIDKNGQPQILDQQNYKIGKFITNNDVFFRSCSFQIFDDNGNEYLFEQPAVFSSKLLYAHYPDGCYWTDMNGNFSLTEDLYWLTEQNRNSAIYDADLMKTEMMWYLTKIKCHQTGEEINFEYNKYTCQYETPEYANFIFYLSKDNNGIVSTTNMLHNPSNNPDSKYHIKPDGGYKDIRITKYDHIVLKKITTPNEIITINEANEFREDITDQHRISNIEIKDTRNNVIKKYEFQHSYFNSYGCSNDVSLCKRLKLESIVEIGNNISKPPYVFEYDEVNIMDSRFQYLSTDIYGYYVDNSDNNISTIPHIDYNDPEYNITKRIGKTCDRTPRFPDMQSFNLLKIIYPTGGKSTFEYEANMYYDEQSQSNKITGGLRIKKITETPNFGVDIINEFSYNQIENTERSSGQIGDKPIFYKAYKGINVNYYQNSFDIWLKGSTNYINDIGTTNGSHIGYSVVTEKNSQNGTIIRKYTNFADHPDEKNSNVISMKDLNEVKPLLPTGYNTTFLPNNNFSSERGLLTEIDYFDKSSNLAKKIINNYSFNYIPEKAVRIENVCVDFCMGDFWGKGYINMGEDLGTFSCMTNFHPNVDIRFEIRRDRQEGCAYNMFLPNAVVAGRYFDVCKMIRLTGSTEYLYTKDGHIITTEKKYNYNNNGYLLSESILNSNNKEYITKYKYPSDYLSSNDIDDYIESNAYAIGKLKSKNILTTPIEILKLKINDADTLIYDGTLNLFKCFNSGSPDKPLLILQKELLKTNFTNGYLNYMATQFDSKVDTNSDEYDFEFFYNNNYKSQMVFDKYDQLNGNLLEFHNKENTPVVYLWSYNNKYIVAEIKNATFTTVSNALSGITPEQLANSVIPDMAKVEALRTALPNAKITTYSYKPLVGILTSTDPRGVTTYYDYDSFNRLKQTYIIENGEKKVLQKYDYHYANQQ